MIRSMTGYGDAAAQEGAVHYHVELRSLNNKYFKVAVRLPEAIAGLEAELESHLRKRVHRGSFTLTVKTKISDAHAASTVNDAALLAYLDHLETIHSKLNDQSAHIDLTALLAMPGVLQPSTDDEEIVTRSRPVLFRLLDEAICKLDAMRVHEGEALAADLLHQREAMLDRLGRVRGRAPAVIDEYHQRLRQRIDQLMAKAELQVNENDLIREVAIFADRADISEELTRMEGHLQQFRDIISADNGDPAGRTLDFMAQEMLREANTMGSKSNDATISRAVVELKSAVDRIKEQVQNVE